MSAEKAAPLVAREVWTVIGTEFNRLRMKNRALAYRTRQQRIYEQFGILTEIMSPKDLLEEARRCEDYMGERESPGVGSPLDELADFLNGKPATKTVQ